MLKNKKGELTTAQLVTIIILIVSFIIILFLLFRLNLGSQNSSEICHNSVVSRSKFVSGIISGPLDCRVDYVCVSGGKDCTSFDSSSETKVNADDKQEIMKALADQMSSCWYKFGEGKIDYVGDSSTKVSCAICSFTAFDSNIQKNTKISYQEFYDYLRTTKKTESQTYLQNIYLTNDLSNFENNFKPEGYLNNEIDFSKQYFVLTGIAKEREGFFKYLFSTEIFISSDKQPIPVVILEKTPENYKEIGCTEFVTKS